MRRRLCAAAGALSILGLLTLAPPPALAQTPEESQGEVLTYRWRLKGVLATLARLIVPGSGHGRLLTVRDGEGLLRSELHVTSPEASKDEYWTYGVSIDTRRGRPLAAWNESRFRGREKRRETRIEEPDLIDVPSGIYLLRTDPPSQPRRMRLWSDGRVYPVLLEPGRKELREHDGGSVVVDHFSVVGLDEPGQRRWKGRLDLWTTIDERAIPVEILFRREQGKVHLTLVSPELR